MLIFYLGLSSVGVYTEIVEPRLTRSEDFFKLYLLVEPLSVELQLGYYVLIEPSFRSSNFQASIYRFYGVNVADKDKKNGKSRKIN